MLFLSSCTKETQYSCNKEIDLWTKNNMDEITTMSRSKFLDYDKEYQQAVFMAFSPEQRKQIWIDKINEVLSLNWTNEERTHIKQLPIILNDYQKLFRENRSEEEKDRFDVVMYKWVDHAKESLGWADVLINAIIVNPNKLLDKKGVVSVGKKIGTESIRSIKTRGEGTAEGPDCNCSQSSGGFIWKDCIDNYGEGGCGISYDCKSYWIGCGAFKLSDCDGMCMGMGPTD